MGQGEGRAKVQWHRHVLPRAVGGTSRGDTAARYIRPLLGDRRAAGNCQGRPGQPHPLQCPRCLAALCPGDLPFYEDPCPNNSLCYQLSVYPASRYGCPVLAPHCSLSHSASRMRGRRCRRPGFSGDSGWPSAVPWAMPGRPWTCCWAGRSPGPVTCAQVPWLPLHGHHRMVVGMPKQLL